MKRQKTILLLLTWTMFAVAQTLSLCVLVDFTFGVFVFVFFYVAAFVLVSKALKNVVQYGNFDKYSIIQRLINYFGLTILVVIFIMVISCGAVFIICGKEVLMAFTPILAIEILITILVFIVLIYHFKDEKEEINDIQLTENETQLKNTKTIEQITIKTGQKLNMIDLNDVYYLQADGDYVQIYTEKQKFLKEQTMKSFEEQLPIDRFLRVHRSYIVNTQKIMRIERYSQQSMMLTLRNNEKLKVSTAGYKLLKAKLGI
jgi:Response regulator of the LytR/AlgR family